MSLDKPVHFMRLVTSTLLPPSFRAVLALIAVVLAAPHTMAQACEGNVTLTAQAEVDAFTCTEVMGNLVINDTGPPWVMITNLDGLAGLTSVGGSLEINFNDLLANVDGLATLSSIGGALRISNLLSLTDVDGLAGLSFIGGYLSISDTDVLTDIDGLAGVTSLGGNLSISHNRALADLAGLAALTSIEGDVQIAYHSSLTNLDGLASITSVSGDLVVWRNGELEACTVGLYDLLSNGGIGGSITISENAPGCNSVEEILAGVSAEDEAAPLVSGLAAPFPNPTAGAASITYTLAEPGEVTLTVYDALGRRVRTLAEGLHPAGLHGAAWSGADLPAGVYVARLEVGDGAWTQRVTLVR